MAILLSVFTAVDSFLGVFLPLEFIEDDFSGSRKLWHAKASYIILAIGVPSLMAFASALSTATDQGDSDNHPNDDEGQDLPTLGQRSESETVATDDETTYDLHLEEELPSLT
mmetsp:Transcript_10838/g.18970  ORF Transcript_10838/g.18970 Transcript_10838/m.18970 type:complete len:112 (+) Transcript_10838:1514-1849(+)